MIYQIQFLLNSLDLSLLQHSLITCVQRVLTAYGSSLCTSKRRILDRHYKYCCDNTTHYRMHKNE